MTALLDIFSRRKKPLIKKGEPKFKAIVDYREKNSLICSELVSEGLQVEFRELKVADYLVKDTAIERKTVTDFVSSMINKRLFKQLEELQQYKNRLLIIEGIDEQDLYNEERPGVNSNAIRGFLLSILLKHNVPIIYTKDYKDTAKFISILAKKKTDEDLSLNVSKRNLSKKERLQFILEGFPGIGPKSAKKLLKEFKTLPNIINATEEELKNILGKKAEIVKRIIDWRY